MKLPLKKTKQKDFENIKHAFCFIAVLPRKIDLKLETFFCNKKKIGKKTSKILEKKILKD